MDIKDWLTAKIAEELGEEKNSIGADEPFETFEFDSLAIISIVYDIETEFNLSELSPTLFTEFNTITKLTKWIQEQV